MSPLLKTYLNQKVIIITTEGTHIIGILIGYDKSINLAILGNNKELQIHRGSEIVSCALLDDSIDENKLQMEIAQFGTLPDTKNKIENEHLIWAKVWQLENKKPNKHKRIKRSN